MNVEYFFLIFLNETIYMTNLAFYRRQRVRRHLFGSCLDLSFRVDHRLFAAAVLRTVIVEISDTFKGCGTQAGQSCLLYRSMLLQLKLLLLLLLLLSLKLKKLFLSKFLVNFCFFDCKYFRLFQLK